MLTTLSNGRWKCASCLASPSTASASSASQEHPSPSRTSHPRSLMNSGCRHTCKGCMTGSRTDRDRERCSERGRGRSEREEQVRNRERYESGRQVQVKERVRDGQGAGRREACEREGGQKETGQREKLVCLPACLSVIPAPPSTTQPCRVFCTCCWWTGAKDDGTLSSL